MQPQMQTQVRVIEAAPVQKVGKLLKETTRRRLLSILSPIGILLLWQVLAMTKVLDTRFFPAPTTIFQAFLDMLHDGTFWGDLKVSSLRIVGGFFLGAVPGVVLGIAMGLFPWVRILFEPIVSALYPIPRLALLPLIMLMFGVGEVEKIVTVGLGTFFLVLLNTVGGVLQLESIYLDVAKNFGCSKWQYFTRIAIPGALPSIFTGLKVGSGMALMLIVAAEMIGADAGIGYRIWSSYASFSIPPMFVSFVVMALIGYIFHLLLEELELLIIPWKKR